MSNRRRGAAVFTAVRQIPLIASLFRAIFLVLAAVPLAVAASDLSDMARQWSARAADQKLAFDPGWLALGHYQRRSLPGGYRSYVSDRRFFFSGQGRADPQAELTATLTAFFDDPPSQCRFVARRQWLVARLAGLGEQLPAADCAEYQQWRASLGASQVVLVYASSYLNSPSSMYGHTFLRFDSSVATQATPYLSYALNFGAVIPVDDNSLLYAWRGLAGGYPGFFGAAPYYDKLKEYSRLENRDLWEYRLNFDSQELDRVLAHAWELREIRFDYYFLKENCSFRLLELLDFARPGSAMASDYPFYAIPVDTVRSVRDAGMVAEVVYRPANLTSLKFQMRSLSAAERRLARQLSADAAVLDSAGFLALDTARRREVTDVAYRYLRYQAERKLRDAETAERSYALLHALNAFSPPQQPPQTPPTPGVPDQGHRTTTMAAGAGYEDHQWFTDLEWRVSYHDLLDDPAGYPAGSSLNMGRLVARFKEDGAVQLQRADIIEITSLPPRDAFFKPISWRLNFGWDRQWTNGRDVLTTQLNGGAGFSYAPAEALGVFALLTGRLEYNPDFDRRLDIAAGVSLGATLNTGLGRTLVSMDWYRFTDRVDRSVYALSHDVTIRRDLALRLGFDRKTSDSDRVSEASVSFRYYF